MIFVPHFFLLFFGLMARLAIDFFLELFGGLLISLLLFLSNFSLNVYESAIFCTPLSMLLVVDTFIEDIRKHYEPE